MTRPAPSSIEARLKAPYDLRPEQIAEFRRDGFIKLEQVLDEEITGHYGERITRETLAHHTHEHVPMEERSAYDQAFIQVMNMWERDETMRELTFSRRLAQIAARLLEVEGVRLYHDQALYKEAGGGRTPLHVDQYYWPMATDRSVTVWIPLQATSIAMGAMEFGRGTHTMELGSKAGISEEAQQSMSDLVQRSAIELVCEPFDLGDVSFHASTTLHGAGPNTTDHVRKAFTVIYMDQEQRLVAPRNENQQRDWEAWTPSTKVGEIMADPKNPVLYLAGALSE